MFSYFWTRSASYPTAIIYILLGLFLTVEPGLSGNIFVWTIAGLTIFFGTFRLIPYLKMRKAGNAPVTALFPIVLSYLIGFIFLFFTEFVLSFLPMVLGILLLLDGIGKLPVLMEARKYGVALPLTFSTIVPLVLGVILIANPFGVTQLVIRIFGISLMADGILDFYTCWSMSKLRP